MINTFDWFKKWAAYNPKKVAISDASTGKKLTYKAIHDAANVLIWYLKDRYALQKGDRIGIISENNVEQVILFAAAQKAGFILVPINFRLSPEEVDYMLNDSKPKVVYHHNSSFDITKLTHKTSYEPIEHVQIFLEKSSSEFSEIINQNDIIFILYTSGTTGFPKGTIYTHKMLFWNSTNTALSLIITNDTVTLNCMPLFHTGGWNVLLTPVLHHGGTIILFKKFDPLKVLNCIVEENLSLFMAVPTMLKMMVELPEFSKTDISCLNYIIVGGESMPLDLIQLFHKKRVPIRQGYGLTEVGPNLTSLHQNDAERKQGSIGRPNFYVNVKVADEKGKQVGVNEKGELLISGPMVTPGYWEKEEASQSSKIGQWFKTGDIAKIDNEGFLYIVDRKKNMYISGGENVYPVEVERVLRQYPSVKEAVVFGIPHQKWGECGVAIIVEKSKLSEEELLDFCKGKLAKFKIPSKIVFVKSIPKNDTGKINRKKLKDDFLNTF
tara:strand:- start:21299 stop:22783 length:1485 start_codon:yes stop_codon:yes gene_type:complete